MSRGCWVTAAAMIRSVSAASSKPVLSTVPQRLTAGFILPRAASSSECAAACVLPRLPLRPTEIVHSGKTGPLQGFRVPSSRRQPVASTCHAEHPAPRYVPSSAFLTPSTVYSATCLAGLFHPAATSRVCPPGVTTPRSRAGSSPTAALLSLGIRTCSRDCAGDGCPRLQGFAPHGGRAGLRQAVRPIRTTHPS